MHACACARAHTHTRSTKKTFAPNCNNLYTDLQLLLCNLQYGQVYFCKAFRNRGSVAATNLPPILAATFAAAQSRLAAVTPQVPFTAANLRRVVQLQQRKAVSSMQSLPPCFAAAKMKGNFITARRPSDFAATKTKGGFVVAKLPPESCRATKANLSSVCGVYTLSPMTNSVLYRFKSRSAR